MSNVGNDINNLWAKSFTSLKADLRQGINVGFLHLAGSLLELFLEGSVLLRLW